MLSNKKIFVSNKREEILEKAFELGWKWGDGTKDIYSRKPFLFFHEDKVITCDTELSYYNSSIYEEITWEEMKELKKEEELKYKIGDKVYHIRVGEYGIVDKVDPTSYTVPCAVAGTWVGEKDIRFCTEEEIKEYFR